MSPQLLDVHLLEELDRRLRAQGVPWVDERPAGLSDEEIDRIAAPLGYVLPEEARRWYRWHDGSDGFELTMSRVQTPLEQDVGDTIYFRDMDDFWRPRWLKAMNEKPYILFDCSGDREDPVPVWYYDYEQAEPTRPRFASIGEMVSFWIRLVDESYLTFDAPQGFWIAPSPLPDEISRLLVGVPYD